MNLLDLQREVGDGHRPLLGVSEEVGELCHAHLKAEQKIRGEELKHIEDKIDAIGDIIIYLLDYCEQQHINFEQAVQYTWEKVKQRDWKKNPESG